MINQEFIAKYGKSINESLPTKKINAQIMKKLDEKKHQHCLPNDNHHPQIVSFIQSAKSMGFSKEIVVQYIRNHIPIAQTSRKSKHGAIEELAHDLYERYPYSLTGSNVSVSMTPNFECVNITDPVYQKLLESINPVNLLEVISEHDDNYKTLTETHYRITLVDAVLKSAKQMGYDFHSKHKVVHLFNGEYWVKQEDDYLKLLLKIAGKKLGFNKYKAESYSFSENVLKQFIDSTILMNEVISDEIMINLKNGTFVFGGNAGLKKFDKRDFFTYQLPFEYNPDAQCDLFTKYLDRVLPDKDCQMVLAEYLGYVFTKGHKLQKCLLLFGGGANGKSVFFEIVRALLGKENVTSYSMRELEKENTRADIEGKLLNYSSEIDANGINKDGFKKMVSGEPIQAKILYKDTFLMDNYGKMIFNCNEFPRDVEYTEAFFRRFLIIPFTQTIPEAEQDKDLAEKIIKTELSGVFNWILQGMDRFIKQDYKCTTSQAVQDMVIEFKQESDAVFQFLRENNYVASAKLTMPLSVLFTRYKIFCADNNFRPPSNKTFSKRLEFHGLSVVRRKEGNVVYIEQQHEPDPPNDENVEAELPF